MAESLFRVEGDIQNFACCLLHQLGPENLPGKANAHTDKEAKHAMQPSTFRKAHEAERLQMLCFILWMLESIYTLKIIHKLSRQMSGRGTVHVWRAIWLSE